MSQRKIGIALGSGSARGWAHIGVIRALEAQGVTPDIVCGTSIGALVGASYVSGTLALLEKGVRNFKWREVFGYMDMQLTEGGLLDGAKLVEFFRDKIDDQDIRHYAKRYGAVATDLYNGQEVWLKEGPLLEGVHASLALPGLFAPVRYQDRWLVDGGLVNPVPVSLCRALGADIVIAVNLNGDLVGRHFRNHVKQPEKSEPERGELIGRVANYLGDVMKTRAGAWFSLGNGKEGGPPGVFDVMASAINIMQDRITRSRMVGDPPDVMLAPELGHIGLFEFDRGAETIEAGWLEVEKQREAILKAVGKSDARA